MEQPRVRVFLADPHEEARTSHAHNRVEIATFVAKLAALGYTRRT